MTFKSSEVRTTTKSQRPEASHTPDTNKINSSLELKPIRSRDIIMKFLSSWPRSNARGEVRSKEQIRPTHHVLAAFVALCLSIFLVALDTVLIPTALPTISRSFRISDSVYAWTGSSYLLANASSVPFWGKLSDVFGRKPVILAANAVFLGGSILCAISKSSSMLISGRVVQGLGGGGVVVLVHVCVSDLFTIRDRSFYMGTVGAVWALASALGPVLGGVFAQRLHWTWCFYINIPIVSLAIVVLYLTLHVHNPRVPLMAGLAAMDWLGTITIVTATVLLLVGLQVGGVTSYSNAGVLTCLVFGPIAYIAFPFSQHWVAQHGGSPIMPLRIFKDISNLCALAVCACDTLVFTSVAYFLPLYFQVVLGRSSRFGPNFGTPLIALQTRIRESDIASGTAAFGFVRTISGAIGLVLGQVVFQLLMAPYSKEIVDSGVTKDIASKFTGGEAISHSVIITELTESQAHVVRHGFMSALRGMWIFYTTVGAVGLLVSFGIKRTNLHRSAITELNKMECAPSDDASDSNMRARG
ncbi:Efflux pump [Alternaria alternata]|nr:Efflux pump [Alternaria alternata]